MNASTAISTITNIAFVIVVFFAVPIVMPVAGLLATLMIIFNSLYAIGVILQIVLAYNPGLIKL
jgi:hypothetical protein